MARILIITDQPIYDHSPDRIAGASIGVESIFAGDIIEGNFDALSKVKGAAFDSVLHPITIDTDSHGHDKVFTFVTELRQNNLNMKVHLYGNTY